MERTFIELSMAVGSLIASAPALQEWPECRQLLVDMLGEDEPWIHALPILSCQAAGGESTDALPVAAAWLKLLHAGNLIDDVQDGDFARLTQFGKPETAIAIALAWIFSAFRLLEDSSLTPESRFRISEIFTRAGISSSRGQFQDLISGRGTDRGNMLAAYWEMVINKSGSIFLAGTAGGAALGTDGARSIDALSNYGNALGVVRQVLDDCRDFQIDAKKKTKQATLPVILQELVTGDETFYPLAIEKQAEKSSRYKQQTYRLLAEAGIPDIIADILLEWRRRAMHSLQILEPSESREALAYIFEYVMRPKPHDTGATVF